MIKARENYGYYSVFPERFRNLMSLNNVTQGTLAKIIGVKRQSISLWANGETRPDLLSLVKIAKHFNVSTDYLLGLTDVKSTDRATKELCDTLGLSEDIVLFLLHSKLSSVFKYYKEDCLSEIKTRELKDEIYNALYGDVSDEEHAEKQSLEILNYHTGEVTMCLNRLISEYIESITSGRKGSLLSELIGFYLSIYTNTVELYDQNDMVEPQTLPKAFNENSALSFIFGDNCSREVKLKELLINSQILDITAKLDEIKNNALNEREGRE